ncbi:MAG: MFS transporter [Acidithiobacillus ferriphilus]|nr:MULTISPECIES: MFS transporter [Acidithiobacillus]MBU2851006.1 MFS transporter [Acidithiobacillus ferrivorans]MCR2831837.1 MFS transporter [Acidithiobacillus ferrooxidans]OFA17163.1 hypothetical protein A4U49_03550 [Acidithiobacillus ferrivorans]
MSRGAPRYHLLHALLREKKVNLRSLFDAFSRQEKSWLTSIPRPRAIALLALTQGLASVNIAALGAVAPSLEHDLAIGNVAFGLFSAASILTGALAALPIGILGDRQPRVPLLTKLIYIWAAAIAISAISPNYVFLLVMQMVAGAAGVAVGPIIASLSGDLFPPSWRSRAFGLIVGGELLGAGIGMAVAGTINALGNWRVTFYVLAAMAFILAYLLKKGMREPTRDNMGKLAQDILIDNTLSSVSTPVASVQADTKRYLLEDINEKQIQPVGTRILREDPTYWPWLKAARSILSIPSNIIFISASSAGYFYFTGLMAFGVLYLTQRFDLNTMSASLIFVGIGLGGVGGVIASGWLADYLLRRGMITARVWVTAISFLLTIPFFLLALQTSHQWSEIILFFFGAVALGATNPSLDAARLDIMHSRLWGRAEGIRISLRYILEAAAPLAFGWVSEYFPEQSCHLAHCRHGYGLQISFQIFLVLLAVATVLLLIATRTYPRDVATALFSEQPTRS